MFPGGWQLFIVLLIILLLFGSRLPGLARALGQGIVEFRKGLKGDDDNQKELPGGGAGGGADKSGEHKH
jgi:sec-independent protein translocase protein TatA